MPRPYHLNLQICFGFLVTLLGMLHPLSHGLRQDPDIQDDFLPAPKRSAVLRAWRKRQDAVKSARFTWTERQAHIKGWVANPRYRERERLADSLQPEDGTYDVSKTLSFDGNKMRYSYDGKRGTVNPKILLPDYYVSVFDGETAKTYQSSGITKSLVGSIRPEKKNIDAQNLDTRPILLTFRPLDPVMGYLPIGRAFTAYRRYKYKGRSIMAVEERHDSTGWKASLWIEPERDFIVRRCLLYLHGKIVVDIEIDYNHDPKCGWVPRGWQVLQMKPDGTKWESAVAEVSSYSINVPIGIEEFQ